MASPPTEPPQAGRTRTRLRDVDVTAVGLIAVIFLTEAVIGILLLAINPQYPASELHVGVRFTGLAISVYGAAKMPGQPIGGWLADRMEPRIVLIVGLVLALPVIVVMERLQYIWVYIGAWVLFGLALAVVWPTVYSIVGHRFRTDLQGRLLALVSMGQIAGTAAGFVVGAVVVDHVSYIATFGLAFLLELAAVVVAALVVRGGDTATRRAAAVHGESAAGFASIRGLLSATVLMLIVVIMLLSVAVAMLTPDLKPYSEQVLRLKYSTFVLVLVPPALVAALLLVPAGYLADRFGRNLPIGIGVFLFPASLLAVTLTRSPIGASLFSSFAAAGYVLMLPALSASLLDLSSSNNRGLLTGVSTSIQAIGLVVGPAIGGVLIDGYGPLAPFRAAVVIMLAAGLLVLIYARRTRTLYHERRQNAVDVPRPTAAAGCNSHLGPP